MALTADEVDTLIILERTAASVSATSTLILLTTFCSIKAFRTLSNTLIFYASFANLFANIAALIGGSALDDLNSPLCQFQAFLLEMFMQSDPFWACAMAVNIYLIFFKRYDPVQLKKLHWVYFLLCYGLPFIPAMFCLFYKDEKRGKMYGNATLWCWIDGNWKWVRIYSYYIPIWVSIVISLVIYSLVGFEIYRVRSQIRALGNSSSDYTSNNYNSGTFNSETCTSQTLTSGTLNSVSDNRRESQAPSRFDGPITKIEDVPRDGIWRIPTAESPGLTYHDHAREERFGSQATRKDSDFGLFHEPPPPISHPSYIGVQQPNSPLDPIYRHPAHDVEQHTPSHSPQRTTMDKVKWAYTKCALLFGVSILITWVPASINRVHGLTNSQNPNFALNVMSAIVLPLQGFWNTVIFFTTSWSITKRTIRKWRKKSRGGKERGKQKEKGNMSKRHGRKGKEETVKMKERNGGADVKGKAAEVANPSDAVRESSGRTSDRTLAEEVV